MDQVFFSWLTGPHPGGNHTPVMGLLVACNIAARWWRGKSTPCGSYQLTADSCNNLHGSCRAAPWGIRSECGKLLLIAPASRALRSRAHYECNVLTDNSGRELVELVVQQVAGRQTVRQIVLPLLIGNFWHAQQRFLYRFMMTTDRQTEAEGELQRGKERG